MSLKLIEVKDAASIGHVVALADVIWSEHFTSIIGQSQVEYMLAKFQSVAAITSQLSAGYEYFLVESKGSYIAYMALVAEADKMMISKIYTRRETRGCGLGKAMLSYAESRCVEDNIATLWLTVNRYNAGPVSWYKRQGFSIVESVKADIGAGFFMDDYIMEKAVEVSV